MRGFLGGWFTKNRSLLNGNDGFLGINLTTKGNAA